MKKILYNYQIPLLLCIILLWNPPFAKAQEEAKKEKFIIKTSEPSKLRMIEKGWGKKIPMWRKSGNGYLLEYDNPEEVDVKSAALDTADITVFRLLRLSDGAETTYIRLKKGQSISLHNCIRFYRRESVRGVWRSVWERVKEFVTQPLDLLTVGRSALFRASSTSAKVPIIEYRTANRPSFITPNTVAIRWENYSKKRAALKVTLKDLQTGEVSTQERSVNFFPNEQFPQNKLKAGHKYLLSVEEEGRYGAYDLHFSILSDAELQLLEEFTGGN